jgi:hypothetical protein
VDEVHLAGLSINGVLGGVEVLDACFGDAVLAPELVLLLTILCVRVSYNVFTVGASDDEDFAHLVNRISSVPVKVWIAWFHYCVADLAIVDGLEDCLVALVYPVLGHLDDLLPSTESVL